MDAVQTPQHKTLQLLSDEVHLYWLWTVKTSDPSGQEGFGSSLDSKKVDLCLQEFKLEPDDGEPCVMASPCGDAVVVMKKEEPLSSLSSPLPVRRSPTTPTPVKDSDGEFGLVWSIIASSSS